MKFLGCGSAFNPLMGNTSAYMEMQSQLFLIDAGESVFLKLYQQKLLKKHEKITVLITHTHADHVGSLPSIISYCYYVLGKKIKVIHPNNTLWSLLDLMGIEEEAYTRVQMDQVVIKNVKITAIPVKHAIDIKCYGYIIEYSNQKIFYSGDSYEIPKEILDKFYNKEINRIYQDTTEFPSNHLSHCPLEVLEKDIPRGLRKNVYCMHFTNDFTEKIKEKGFQCVNS